MTYKRWYALMLFLPLLVPAVLFTLADVYSYHTVMADLGRFTHLLFVTSLIASVPYLFFAVAVTLWCWHRPLEKAKALTMWLPWAFSALLGLFFFAAFLLFYPDGDAGKASLFLMAFCVPVGFVYVFVVRLLTLLAVKFGIVKETHGAA